MKSLVFLFAVIALGAAQQRCLSPKLFMSNISITSNEMNGPRRGMYHGEVTLYYDFDNQRIRTDDIFFRVPSFNSSLREWTFDFYKEEERYRYSVERKTCTKEKLTTKFQPIEVPATARYLGEQTIGVEGMIGNSVSVALWAGEEEGAHYSRLFTHECVPVLDFFNSQTDWRHVSFFDVRVMTEVPPTWFELPEPCKT